MTTQKIIKPAQTVEVVGTTRAKLEALAARLGLRNPIKLHFAGQFWVATFLSSEELERQQTEQHLVSLGY